jgi:DNA polymerase
MKDSVAQTIPNRLVDLLRDTREHVRFLGELGLENVDLSAPDVAAISAFSPAEPAFSSGSQVQPSAAIRTPVLTVPPKVINRIAPQDSLFNAATATTSPTTTDSLHKIWSDIGDCTRCGLCEGRTQVVNTHGNPKARLLFVGEAPGADEDAQGKPFVGRAGQLLTKMIEAMGMKREEVIIGNVNRCRPPGNRQPTLEEAAICRPFLFREIAVIKPEVIVVMGNTALRNLLEIREGITRVRGRFQNFRGIKVMPTFHPAYLLRDPSKKRETWEDLKMVRDYLESFAPKP